MDNRMNEHKNTEMSIEYRSNTPIRRENIPDTYRDDYRDIYRGYRHDRMNKAEKNVYRKDSLRVV